MFLYSILPCIIILFIFGQRSSQFDRENVFYQKVSRSPRKLNATMSVIAEEAFEGIKAFKKYERRPLYLFGHMANTIGRVKDYLEDGANSIECDVQFHDDGQLKIIQHGLPCDVDLWLKQLCRSSEEVTAYLNFIRTLSQKDHPNYNENMTILMMDMKIRSLTESAKKTAGQELARKLLQTIFQEDEGANEIQPVYVSLSLPSENEISFVEGAMRIFSESKVKKYRKYIGWDTGSLGDYAKTSVMWEKGKVGSNIWQGDGITPSVWPFKTYRGVLTALNDRNARGITKKVYVWTLIHKPYYRDVLGMGVDGILSNKVHEVVEILSESKFKSHYRKATRKDSPWKQIIDGIFYDLSALNVSNSEDLTSSDATTRAGRLDMASSLLH